MRWDFTARCLHGPTVTQKEQNLTYRAKIESSIEGKRFSLFYGNKCDKLVVLFPESTQPHISPLRLAEASGNFKHHVQVHLHIIHREISKRSIKPHHLSTSSFRAGVTWDHFTGFRQISCWSLLINCSRTPTIYWPTIPWRLCSPVRSIIWHHAIMWKRRPVCHHHKCHTLSPLPSTNFLLSRLLTWSVQLY